MEWNMNTGILNRVWELTFDAQDPRRDGFYTFEKKKTLLMIKKIIDSELPKLPVHVGEKEWIKEQGINYGN